MKLINDNNKIAFIQGIEVGMILMQIIYILILIIMKVPFFK